MSSLLTSFFCGTHTRKCLAKCLKFCLYIMGSCKLRKGGKKATFLDPHYRDNDSFVSEIFLLKLLNLICYPIDSEDLQQSAQVVQKTFMVLYQCWTASSYCKVKNGGVRIMAKYVLCTIYCCFNWDYSILTIQNSFQCLIDSNKIVTT